MAGERPERDVLALAAVIRLVDGGHNLGASALAEALIDAGYTLSKSAPDPQYTPGGLRYPTLDELHGGPIRADLPMLRPAATPSPEPLPREARDVALRAVVADVVWELRHRKPNVSDADIAGVLERAALSPDWPTPP